MKIDSIAAAGTAGVAGGCGSKSRSRSRSRSSRSSDNQVCVRAGTRTACFSFGAFAAVQVRRPGRCYEDVAMCDTLCFAIFLERKKKRKTKQQKREIIAKKIKKIRKEGLRTHARAYAGRDARLPANLSHSLSFAGSEGMYYCFLLLMLLPLLLLLLLLLRKEQRKGIFPNVSLSVFLLSFFLLSSLHLGCLPLFSPFDSFCS